MVHAFEKVCGVVSLVLDANYSPNWLLAESLGGKSGGGGGGLGGGFCKGGGVQEGWLGGGGSRWGNLGAHAPKAKRWSITGSPYLPLPSL